MTMSKEELIKEFRERLKTFKYGPTETKNEGHSVEAFTDALREGSTPEANKLLQPALDELVLKL